MIQRIQTLFMVLAVAALTAFYFVDIMVFRSENEEYHFSLLSSGNGEEAGSNFSMIAPYAVGLAILLIVINIFMYGNRRRQIRIADGITFLLLGILTFMMITPDKIAARLGGEWLQSISAGYYLPLIAIVCMILARRAIKKDDQLVRDSDRLR